ncbi:MAG: phytase [Acidimicrobiia bacterium]|nr:phytase [Acidimicrobiia bacterium]
MFKLVCLNLTLLLTACAPARVVQPALSTEKLAGDPDDPAIWIHPSQPERSLIIATVKEPAPVGAIVVFDVKGRIQQTIPGIDRPNNVDVEYGLMLGGQPVDIAVATERLKKQLRVFAIAHDGSGIRDVTSEKGIPVFGSFQGEQASPMGIALYKRPSDGAIFAIVGRKTGPQTGYLHQYRLEDDGTGKAKGVKVREFGNFSGSKEIEAIAVDDELGYVYYADEDYGIHKWHADPDHPEAGKELAVFGTQEFKGNHEGIAIYTQPDGKGYIVCTDQLPGGSRLHLFAREGAPGNPHDHSKPIKIVTTSADSTDGIQAASVSLGSAFPHGLLVMMNSKEQNFHYYRWEDVAGAAGSQLTSARK